jgi:beta-lactamase class A
MNTPQLLARRHALRSAAVAIAAPAIVACGGGSSFSSYAQTAPPSVIQAAAEFAALAPETTGVLVRVDAPLAPWSTGHGTERKLFVASGFKTFVLAQFLRDSEGSGSRLSQNNSCDVNDQIRSLGSPVYGRVSGMSDYGKALEGMIAHSDNTATDIALAAAGPDRIRALIAQAGLAQTQIPESTRRFYSYLAGAPIGVDLDWSDMLKIQNGESTGFTERKDVINDTVSMLSSATDMVTWYQQALAGKYFTSPDSLREFKRISSMATALWLTVPEDTVSYGKGGSVDWEDFHALFLAGQMRVKDIPVSFSFTLNWTGGTLNSNTRIAEFGAAISKVLYAVNTSLRTG